MAESPPPNARTISVALKLLQTQRKAVKAYYQRNAEAMKARSAAYWNSHRDEINRKRRERYALAHPKARPVSQGSTSEGSDVEQKPLPLL